MEKFKISQPNKTEMLELVVTKEGESRQGCEEPPIVHLPHGGGRQMPGRPGAALEKLGGH